MKFLIVEDEPFERYGLRDQLMEYVGPNVFVAGNIREAKEIMNNNVIDVMLLDIKLRDESGLDLARYARKKYPEIEIIILTAYNDFNYAKSAMSLNITNYLSKPVRFSLLCDAINNVINKKKIVSSSSLIWPFFENVNIEKINSIIPFEITLVFSIFFSQLEENNCENQYKFLLTNFPTEKCIIEIRRNHLLGYWGNSLKDFLSFTDSIKLNYNKFFSGNYVIGIGINEKDIITTFNNSIAACRNKIFYPYEDIFIYKNVTYIGNESPKLCDELEQKVVNNVLYGSEEELIKILPILIKKIIDQSSKNYSVLEKIIESISIQITRKNMEYSSSVSSVNNNNKDTDNIWFSDKNLFNYFFEMSENIRKESGLFSSNPYIKKAIQYINKHYSKDISLNEICTMLSISPGYFSRLFKSESGISFKSYITFIRMQEAKKLINNGKLTISQVAKKTGFSNSNYFGNAFKKYYGMSPTDYKKTNMIE